MVFASTTVPMEQKKRKRSVIVLLHCTDVRTGFILVMILAAEDPLSD